MGLAFHLDDGVKPANLELHLLELQFLLALEALDDAHGAISDLFQGELGPKLVLVLAGHLAEVQLFKLLPVLVELVQLCVLFGKDLFPVELSQDVFGLAVNLTSHLSLHLIIYVLQRLR